MAPRHDRHGQVITQEYAAEVPVSDLVEHPDNPRRGDTSVIADSIAHNGFYGAVIAQRATNRVLAGNHRLRAAVSEGLETLPVIWVDVDNEAASRILLADNRTSDLAGFDNSDLAELLEQLTGTDAHLAGTGYTQADLDMLLEDLAGDDPPDNLGDTDELPDPPPPKTVPGDIWLLGPHRVMCGNSTSPTDVAALLDGTLADAVWTDPPYGVSYVGKTAAALTISNDGADEFETVLDGAFDSILTASKPGAPVYVAAPAGPQSVSFAQRLLDRNLFRQRLIWVKNTLVLGHSDYHYRHEDIYFGYTPAPKGSGVLGRGGGLLAWRQRTNVDAVLRQAVTLRGTSDHQAGRPDRPLPPQPPRQDCARPVRRFRLDARSRSHAAPRSVPHGTRPQVRRRDLSPLPAAHWRQADSSSDWSTTRL